MSSDPQPSTYATALLHAAAHRRTVYHLKASSTIPDSDLIEILESCVLNVPSAFNAQSTRITLHTGPSHHALWDMTSSTLASLIGPERFEHGATRAKMERFRAAHGSILFWDDPRTVMVQSNGALLLTVDKVDDKAREWTQQSNGMHQFYVWLAIESYPNMGANLQHYNPLIDDKVKERWDLPREWVLKAQMVFGEKVEGGAELEGKEQRVPLIERLRAFAG